MILSLLSKIKLTHILIIGVTALALGFMYFKGKYEAEKETSKLRKQNYEQVLKLTKKADSMQVVNLKFQTRQEVESYINQNETLKNLLAKQGFQSSRDYKKLQDLTLSSIKYYDSLISSFNASVLVDKIKNDENGIYEFSKQGECISYDGNVTFSNGELSVNTTNETFTGNILLTKSLGKRKKGFPSKKLALFRFGKRKENLTATTDCGDVNIQVIEKLD